MAVGHDAHDAVNVRGCQAVHNVLMSDYKACSDSRADSGDVLCSKAVIMTMDTFGFECRWQVCVRTRQRDGLYAHV